MYRVNYNGDQIFLSRMLKVQFKYWFGKDIVGQDLSVKSDSLEN